MSGATILLQNTGLGIWRISSLKLLLSPFTALSAGGLVLSIVVHILAWFDVPSPLGRHTWLLHVGIFVVWLPAVFVAQRLTREYKAKDTWKALLRGSPPWMQRMTQSFFLYALVNFFVFMIADKPADTTGPEMSSVTLRGFSGHWIAFYSAALAVLYSAARADECDAARRCPNGHMISAAAKFCEECGSSVTRVDN